MNLNTRIGSAFFACAWIEHPGDQELEEKFEQLGGNLVKIEILNRGTFISSCPFYADKAENEHLLLIKLGIVHDGTRQLSAEEMLARKQVSGEGIDWGSIQGSASLVLLDKQQGKLLIYRNLLSTFEIKYWSDAERLIVSDNLRLMSRLVPWCGINQAAVPQHFIYRTVYGRQTYLHKVDRLLAGEQLRRVNAALRIDMVHNLEDLLPTGDLMPVNTENVASFMDMMQLVIGIYLAGSEAGSATMLSGGVDSSLIQAAINRNLQREEQFPSFSFSVDSPSFAYEVEYAWEASQALGTHHQFVKISAEAYRQNLVSSIQLLGQPIPDDVRPCFLALTDELGRSYSNLQLLFHGQIADGLHGVGSSLEVVQGDKYRSWPVGVLSVLGKLLNLVSQSKSYGATRAAEILRNRVNLKSPQQFLNAVGLYTDWGSVLSSFSEDEINQALTMKRVLGYNYLDSDLLVEQLNVLDLVTDGVDPACVVNQFGLYHSRQYVFPYSDETIVKATFAFQPLARYTNGHKVKPVLKAALESQLPAVSTSQPKGWSGIGEQTLFGWMRDGELQELVMEIERPGFMSQEQFKRKLEQPDWFTWNLLTLDLFKKEVLGD